MVFFFQPVQRVSEITVKQRLIRIDWAGTALVRRPRAEPR